MSTLAASRRAVVTLSAIATLAALITVDVRAAGLLVPERGGEPLSIETQDVSVDILDGIAVTTVDQVFRNPTPQPLEAVYSFPLPEDASLSGFSLWINGREMAGEILPRDRARTLYDEIAHPALQDDSTGRGRQVLSQVVDPGVAEQVSYREFRATVFPVLANSLQRVRLIYVQQLVVERDVVRYTYPMETRAVEDSLAQGRFSLDVTLRSAVPLDDLEFPSTEDGELTVMEASSRVVRASVHRDDGDLDRDFVMSYRQVREAPGLDVRVHRRPGEDGTFMLLVSAPDLSEEHVAAPRDYTFIVDVSGSMRRRRRLDVAAEALERFLAASSPKDRFNVIVFNVEPVPLANTPVANVAEEREQLSKFLRKFHGVGGTDLYPALELAYDLADPSRQQAFIVVSDGGLSDLDEEHRRFLELVAGESTPIFGLSVGNDANSPLLNALADATGGFTAQVSTREDLRRRGAALRERLRSQPWRELELDVLGPATVREVTPRVIPDLYPGRQVVIAGRYFGAGPTRFNLRGQHGDQEVVFTTTVDLPHEDRELPEIRRTWARKRVDDLLQGLRSGELPERTREDVLRLGMENQIVTPFTSFLVLETEEMYRERGIERRSHALLEEERTAREERARRFDETPPSVEVIRGERPREGALNGVLSGALDGWSVLLAMLTAACAGWAMRRRA